MTDKTLAEQIMALDLSAYGSKRDLGWHRIYDETGDALAALTAWRAGK